MKDKQELIEEVKALPLFVIRQKAVKDDNGEWVLSKTRKAVTIQGQTEIIADISNDYKLVQHHEHMLPIIDQFGEVKGKIKSYKGIVIMDLLPEDPEYFNDDFRIGISAYNSVDTTCGLIIRFILFDNEGHTITVPNSISSWKKKHMGNIVQKSNNYIEVLASIKQYWHTIIDKFSKTKVTLMDLKDQLKFFELPDRTIDDIEAHFDIQKDHNLWDIMMMIIDYMEQKNFKSEVHRRKNIDKFCDKIYQYSLAVAV